MSVLNFVKTNLTFPLSKSVYFEIEGTFAGPYFFQGLILGSGFKGYIKKTALVFLLKKYKFILERIHGLVHSHRPTI